MLSKLYIPSAINIWKKVLTKAIGADKNVLVSGRLACTSSKTEILNRFYWISSCFRMFFHPKNLKRENNNPWFNILLYTQSIVCAIVDSQCLEYSGYTTLEYIVWIIHIYSSNTYHYPNKLRPKFSFCLVFLDFPPLLVMDQKYSNIVDLNLKRTLSIPFLGFQFWKNSSRHPP